MVRKRCTFTITSILPYLLSLVSGVDLVSDVETMDFLNVLVSSIGKPAVEIVTPDFLVSAACVVVPAGSVVAEPPDILFEVTSFLLPASLFAAAPIGAEGGDGISFGV
eukprot:TRINITY_DN10169_c0_g1_i1.p2 TRINITY_DN10169_c0_g1~~TRINITY_DN10169_c0_g1_i1.p2  ORF type:complete len:108 (+),score=24.70 TRINITY_DN10169_c0_g1_i1:55-378(+)